MKRAIMAAAAAAALRAAAVSLAPGGYTTIVDRRERATLFGVYEFLMRYAGVRMYFQGEPGTIIPKTAAL